MFSQSVILPRVFRSSPAGRSFINANAKLNELKWSVFFFHVGLCPGFLKMDQETQPKWVGSGLMFFFFYSVLNNRRIRRDVWHLHGIHLIVKWQFPYPMYIAIHMSKWCTLKIWKETTTTPTFWTIVIPKYKHYIYNRCYLNRHEIVAKSTFIVLLAWAVETARVFIGLWQIHIWLQGHVIRNIYKQSYPFLWHAYIMHFYYPVICLIKTSNSWQFTAKSHS